MIWIPNQLVGAPLGGSVTLECHTESSPRAISYWAFDDQMVLNTEHFESSEKHHAEYKLDARLTIRNLREENFGSYRCISKNSLGETDGTIMLYRLDAPDDDDDDEDVVIVEDDEVEEIEAFSEDRIIAEHTEDILRQENEKKRRKKGGKRRRERQRKDPQKHFFQSKKFLTPKLSS